MISDEEIEEALDFLVNVDEKLYEYVFKARKAEHMLAQREALEASMLAKTMGADKAKWAARATEAWENAAKEEAHWAASRAALYAKIEGYRAKVDVWRTQQASSRKGNI